MIDAGSILKPFIAAAWAAANGPAFPNQICTRLDRCWRAGGHGRLGLEAALAQSCNTYFRKLAAAPDTKYGLDPATPLGVVRAYAELVQRTGEPGVPAILGGLAEAAKSGTAKALGGGVLAKTGTAHCPRDAGDGFAVVLFPAAAPRFVVMARVHGTTGAVAAAKLAPALRAIRSGK